MESLITLTEEQLIELRELINDNLVEETKQFYKIIHAWFEPIVGFLPTRAERVSDNIHVYLLSNDN
jgi:hypothetical protein